MAAADRAIVVPRPRYRPLEDERWLAMALLLPTMVLLALFIAYPFVEGILLSVSNARVGVPGEFVGLATFEKIWNDSIFRTAVYNTFVYTGVTTVFNNDHDNTSKLGLGKDKEYIEVAEGKLFDAKGAKGRYVRLYSNGNTTNDLTHYVEVEVYGSPK